MNGRRACAAALATLGALAVRAPAAGAATLDGGRRPRGLPGGAVHLDPGRDRRRRARGHGRRSAPARYVEGTGAPGSNALTIAKSLTLKGAGADLVTITPRRATARGSCEAAQDIRNGVGDIVTVVGDTDPAGDGRHLRRHRGRQRRRRRRPASSSSTRRARFYRSRVTNVITSELGRRLQQARRLPRAAVRLRRRAGDRRTPSLRPAPTTRTLTIIAVAHRATTTASAS